MKDLGLADRLRARGLTVIEIDGWQDRGRTYATFAPQGSVNHHTAGAQGTNAPSLGIVINGRSDLPGPLCNVYMDRMLQAYVIAAGVANHAGRGGWLHLKGNQTVHGLEIENDGYPDEPLYEAQADAAARVHAAFLEAPGSSGDAGLACQHFEWSIEGKIDFHQWPGDDLRSRIAAHLAGVVVPDPVKPPPIPAVLKDERMYLVTKNDGSTRAVYITNGIHKRWIHDDDEAKGWLTVLSDTSGKQEFIRPWLPVHVDRLVPLGPTPVNEDGTAADPGWPLAA